MRRRDRDATWDCVLRDLRVQIERGELVPPLDVDDDEPIRAAVSATLALLAAADDGHGGQGLREAAVRAGWEDLPAGRLVRATTSTARTAWERLALAEPSADELARSGRKMAAALEIAGTQLADGFMEANVERAAIQAEARRAFLDELLVSPPQDARDALRRRRKAERHGLEPDRIYRLTIASAGRRATEEDVEAIVQSVRRALGGVPARRGLTFSLPEVAEWRGILVVLDRGGSNPVHAVRDAFHRAFAGLRRSWVAIAGPDVAHVDRLATSMERLREALRTAELVGRTGWVPNADELDLETMLSLDDELRRRAVEAELGPILHDSRLGDVLIETLEAYLVTGQNAHEAARRLHVAPRTVRYRLDRARHLLPQLVDSTTMLRLAVALFAYQLDRRQHRAAH